MPKQLDWFTSPTPTILEQCNLYFYFRDQVYDRNMKLDKHLSNFKFMIEI